MSLFSNKGTKKVEENRVQTFPETSENCKIGKRNVWEKISLAMVNERIKWA